MYRLGAIGFFGKIPAEGDFVSRQLSAALLDKLDPWLSSWLFEEPLHLQALSQAEHPLLLYFVAATVFDAPLSVGLLTISRDAVGRVFPLIMLVELIPESDVPTLTAAVEELLVDLGDLVYRIREGLSLDVLQETLLRLQALYQRQPAEAPEHLFPILTQLEGLPEQQLCWQAGRDGSVPLQQETTGLPDYADLQALLVSGCAR